MRFILIVYVLIGFVFLSCSQTKEKENEANSSFQQVYEMSEMALLMEDMYAELERIRPAVASGKKIETFPNKFNKIQTAKMTSSFERTDEFNRFAGLLLLNLRNMYESKPDSSRIEFYNTAVKTCITCHRSDAGCIGPVSRIGKLIIETEKN